MLPNLDNIKERNEAKKKEFKKLKSKLSKLKKGKLDRLVHEAHQQIFEPYNCLDCANCCKTTGPLLTDRDQQRISKYLGLSVIDFQSKYLRFDEDGDWVFQKIPCVFLNEDNTCQIYEIAPKACREYPHTDRVNQGQILALTFKNAKICPPVFSILDELNKKL
jgi:Fe-S-cluster containining protein